MSTGPVCPRETPPRAWGRQMSGVFLALSQRNTPTGVGKTSVVQSNASDIEKHPHGRGEDAALLRRFFVRPETPPRAWGRRGKGKDGLAERRNTPTGVGKTRRNAHCHGKNWKHPHGRGEDHGNGTATARAGETPPRAWGRLVPDVVVGHEAETPPRAWGRRPGWRPAVWETRNTPTGVGKTKSIAKARFQIWKHPHGRGEDWRQLSQ